MIQTGFKASSRSLQGIGALRGMWESRLVKGERNQRSGGPFESHVTAPIDAFQLSRILESEQMSRELEVAAGLLRAYVDGQVPASEVFDAELLGRYLAVAEAWEAWHAVVWPNMRFYLNPLTMRLEPIGFDADIQEALGVGTTVFAEGILADQMLDDPAVRAGFDRTLQAIRDAIESGELIEYLQGVEDPALRTLRTEYVLNLMPIGVNQCERIVGAVSVSIEIARLFRIGDNGIRADKTTNALRVIAGLKIHQSR